MIPVSKDVFDRAIVDALRPLKLSLSSHDRAILRKHYEAVISTNRTLNLTRITDPVQAAVKHYADALSLVAWTKERAVVVRSLLDIGTGGGFPAIPIAVVRPRWQVTAIDSTRKKIDFLTQTVAELGLRNVELHHAHAQDWPTERRFDLVALRAIGPLSKCISQAGGFIGAGGRIVVYKTASISEDERSAAETLCARSALLVEEPFSYQLETDEGTIDRCLFIYRDSPKKTPTARHASTMG